jgi:hypothetical protein
LQERKAVENNIARSYSLRLVHLADYDQMQISGTIHAPLLARLGDGLGIAHHAIS